MKRYPEYKDSGFDWVGEIPTHWQTYRLQHVTGVENSNVDKKSYPDGIPVRLCNYTDVYNNEFITHRIPFLKATATRSEIDRLSLESGDVIITKDSESWDDIGVSAIVSEHIPDLVCGYHLTLLRSYQFLLLGPFLFRLLQASGIREQFYVSAKGITRYGLSLRHIQNVRVPIAPLDEQRAIAAYLDRKTAQIDALIEKKRKLIDLLREQRTAIINRAVTKGLDPDVPMKDSGIEWLGEVPAHWVTYRLQYVTSIENSNVDKKSYPDGVPVLLCNYTEVYNNEFINHSLPFLEATATTSEIDRLSLKSGDVIITKDSESWDDIGVPALVSEYIPELVCGYHLTLLRSYQSLLFSPFLFRLLQASGIREQFYVSAKGITRYGLSLHHIQNVRVPIAPLDEQCVIAAYLDRKTAQIDTLIMTENESIILLQEIRTSLISEVVTGKIDVRDEVTA